MFEFLQKIFQKEKRVAEREVAPAPQEPIPFDFKKEMNKRVREDIRPILKKNGFKMRKPKKYIRERNGLLQEISFEIHQSKLRTWSNFMPLYMPWLGVVNWGTSSSNVDTSLRGENPYAGYDDIGISDWPPEKVV